MADTLPNPSDFAQFVSGLRFRLMELHGVTSGTLTATFQGNLAEGIVPAKGRIEALRVRVGDAGVTAAAQINSCALLRQKAGSPTTETLVTVEVDSLTAADQTTKGGFISGATAVVEPGDLLKIAFVDAGSGATGPIHASVSVNREFEA